MKLLKNKIFITGSLPAQGRQNCINEGSTFLVAVFLSVIILSVGLGAAQMVIKELNFSSDLLFGEQAYYAAESGVETALINLKKYPVQNIDNVEEPLGQASFFPDIANAVVPGETFNFDLAPLQSSRFRLLRDVNPGLGASGYDTEMSPNFDIEVSPAGNEWQWKVLCQDAPPGNGSHALQNNTTASNVSDFLYSSEAEGPIPGGGTEVFSNWVTITMDPKSCFFSVQNLSPDPLNFTFTPRVEALAPAVAKVESTGKSGARQKRIEFDYAQQNLGGLFDFVFFHWDEN